MSCSWSPYAFLRLQTIPFLVVTPTPIKTNCNSLINDYIVVFEFRSKKEHKLVGTLWLLRSEQRPFVCSSLRSMSQIKRILSPLTS